MKNRIEQLLNGIFEYEQRKLTILPEKLTFCCAPGKTLNGTIRLEPEKGGKTRGFLYSPDPRLVCDPIEFQGVSNEIRYQFDASGLTGGARKEGVLTVCSDCGEYEIPWSVTIEEHREEETPLPFADPDEFAELAKEDAQRAYRYFLLPGFRKLLKEPRLLALYDGLGVSGFSYQSMEEFLTGARLKEPVVFSAEERSWEFDDLTEPVREILKLRRSGWGFHTLRVETDSGFVRPERALFTTDEFAGSSCDLGLIIDTNLMHVGKNYARVTVHAGRQVLTAEIMVRKSGRRPGKDHRLQKEMLKRLEQLYLDFRLGRLEKESWIAQSADTVLAWKRAGGAEPIVELYLVQLWYAAGKRQKAQKQLEMLEKQKSRLAAPERYAFYLYITTFFYREASYVDRVEEEVGRMSEQNRGSWILLWIRLYLREDLLKDAQARYEVVAEQFSYGCRSRILYLEAWQALQANPYLLQRLGEFELCLLHFADREQLLTEEILLQAAGLAAHGMGFDRRLAAAFMHGYEKYPSDELLKAVCRILMKGGKTDREYFGWFEKGVTRRLKLTGLYEAYMASMDGTEFAALPQVIRMYFAYDTSLDYRKRAAVYSNIVKNRKTDPQSYHSLRGAMEKFTLEQLEQEHLTEDLAVLYHAFIKGGLLTRPLAERLTRLLFTYELNCSAPEIRQFVVHSSCRRDEQCFPAAQGRANVRVYDPDSALIAVDAYGQRLEMETCCSRNRLLDEEGMLAWCAKKSPEFPGLVLFLCAQCAKSGLMNQKLLPYFITGCSMEQLEPGYQTKIRGMLLNYYLAHPREDSLPDFLDGISLEEYVRVDKAALITLLAEEGKCKEAFALLDRYGAEDIPLMRLVRICSRMVLELEFEENPMLLALCLQCFESGKYDDKLLRYLLLYYEGPVESMKQIWRAACRFDLDTMLLEEKILMMLMFTRSGTQDSEPVFEAYLKKMGRRKLCRAYVNLKSYEYFVKGLPVADSVFRYIEQDYRRLCAKGSLQDQEEVCRLALLQHYARLPEPDKMQRALALELLEEFSAKGERFAFWLQFDRTMLAPFQLDGRVFAEYVGNPESTVTIFYRLRGEKDEFVQEPVKNCFGGIFVKEFTLFAGEELECRFEEELEGQTKRSDSRILRADTENISANSRYGLLNRMSEALASGDGPGAREAMESYYMLEALAEKVFAT